MLSLQEVVEQPAEAIAQDADTEMSEAAPMASVQVVEQSADAEARHGENKTGEAATMPSVGTAEAVLVKVSCYSVRKCRDGWIDHVISLCFVNQCKCIEHCSWAMRSLQEVIEQPAEGIAQDADTEMSEAAPMASVEVVEQSAVIEARGGESKTGEAAAMPSVGTAEAVLVKVSCYSVRKCRDGWMAHLIRLCFVNQCKCFEHCSWAMLSLQEVVEQPAEGIAQDADTEMSEAAPMASVEVVEQSAVIEARGGESKTGEAAAMPLVGTAEAVLVKVSCYSVRKCRDGWMAHLIRLCFVNQCKCFEHCSWAMLSLQEVVEQPAEAIAQDADTEMSEAAPMASVQMVEQSADVEARHGESKTGEAAAMPSVGTAEAVLVKVSCYSVRKCRDGWMAHLICLCFVNQCKCFEHCSWAMLSLQEVVEQPAEAIAQDTGTEMSEAAPMALVEVVEQSTDIEARGGESKTGKAAAMPTVGTVEAEVVKVSCYTVRNYLDAGCELATRPTVIYSYCL